jgi:hypothetical protein
MERIKLPPTWCSLICKNAMLDVCVEHCAVKRDTSEFELKPGLTLSDMPRFPDTKGMTGSEKFTVMTVYLSAIVDQMQGVPQNEYYVTRRPRINNPPGSQVSSAIPIQDLLHGFQEAVADHTNREEHSDTPKSTPEVVDAAD